MNLFKKNNLSTKAKCLFALTVEIEECVLCLVCIRKLKKIVNPSVILLANAHINHKCLSINKRDVFAVLNKNPEYKQFVCSLCCRWAVDIREASKCPSCKIHAARVDFSGVSDVEISTKGTEIDGERVYIVTNEPV